MEVVSGYKVGSTETAVSKVVTDTTPCSCSPIGKSWKVSLPVGPTVTPVDSQKTIYEYDALGRTVKVTPPPGNQGFTSYEYGATTVKTIDPKGKWKKFENDSLGNLVKVTEPFPGAGTGADFVTTYAYSMFGKLTTVTMPRPNKANSGTVTQTRTFTYNTGGQLLSVTHPENGTVSYSYNADGSTAQKTEAKGQRVKWEYTAAGQPEFVRKFTGVADTTEDTCAKVGYQYGSQSVDGGFSGANLQGRVAAVSTGCAWQRGGRIDELYSYNTAGAVLTKRVRITRGMSPVIKDIVYSFDGEGKLASTKYPDEAKPFVLSYDAMGCPSGMSQEYQPSGLEEWWSRSWASATYGIAGELLTFSWFAGEYNYVNSYLTETRTYNERLQMTKQRTMLG